MFFVYFCIIDFWYGVWYKVGIYEIVWDGRFIGSKGGLRGVFVDVLMRFVFLFFFIWEVVKILFFFLGNIGFFRRVEKGER